ncbi:MAG: hypothetical protein IT189_01655 [Microbacteriaceae bacterium]|uniref:hypothetical protein n=1 Tax=unclassified Microbacterium TaxID=2609290 RepID=UPI0024B74F2F|nr:MULTISPECIES: hypothetical protein [unclassified Microbacterium]MBT9608282.1 hypothetical protein [Microbacterium sp.]MCC6854745.1 hypothetical protein [Microbacteriaceae bacterium]MDI9889549.1 hypothetical protein [Microbacterium sp. IEGM 1404]
MSTIVSFATIQTTFPSGDNDHYRLAQKVAERDQQLHDYGRHGYRFANSVTVPGTEFVTVIDTLTRESD